MMMILMIMIMLAISSRLPSVNHYMSGEDGQWRSGMMPMTFMNLTIETSDNWMRWQVMNGQLSHFFFGKYAGSQKGLPFQVNFLPERNTMKWWSRHYVCKRPTLSFSAPNEVVEWVTCLLEETSSSGKLKGMSVMVEGPVVGKAGNFQDWIAGGLERNVSFIFVHCTLR